MAIPKDGYDGELSTGLKTSVATKPVEENAVDPSLSDNGINLFEEPVVNETSDTSPITPNVLNNFSDNENLDNENEYVKEANLRNLSKNAVDGVTNWITGKNQSNVIESPAHIKEQKNIEARKKANEVETELNGNPVAKTNDSGELLIRPANEDEMAKFAGYANSSDPLYVLNKTGKKGKWKQDNQVILPNLSNIKSLDGDDASLNKFLASVYKTYKDLKIDGKQILQKGERGFKDVIRDAGYINSVDIFADIMNRKRGDRLFNDAELLASRKVIVALEIESLRLLDVALQTKDILDLARAGQAISISGYAQIQLVKLQEDYGRGLAVNRIIAMPSSSRTNAMSTMLESVDNAGVGTAVITNENIGKFLEAYGGEEGLRTFLAMYKVLPTDHSRNQFARNTFMSKFGRSFVEVFQSALLSNPLTHGFNGLGQGVFQQVLIIERALQGDVGEAYTMMMAQFKYMPQALKAGWFALKNEKAISGYGSKFDSDQKAISAEAWGIPPESKWGRFADGTGKALRALGFRPMLAMDEMFKGMSRGMQMEAIAFRIRKETYASVIDTGKIPADFKGTIQQYAKMKSDKAHMKALNSQSTYDEASEFAKMATFQDDLPEGLAKAGAFFNHPLTKIMVPFYKTPTQIIRRISERTALGLFMPSWWKKMVGGSARDKREAIARMGAGTGVSVSLLGLSSGLYGDKIVITGYGETDPKARARWLENNEPYSVGVKQDDGKYKWISYKRLDPISGVLALHADTAYTLRNSNDTEMNDHLAWNATMSVFRYVGTSLPMMQFIGTLTDAVGDKYESGNSLFDRLSTSLFSQATETVGTVVQHIGTGGLFPSGVSNTVNKFVTPNKLNTMPEHEYEYFPTFGMQPAIRGYYTSLNKLRSRIPHFMQPDHRMKEKLNLWGEKLPMNTGSKWQYFLPYRTIDKPEADPLNIELDNIGHGFRMLNRNMGLPKTQLTGAEYTDYIKFFNNPTKTQFWKDNPNVAKNLWGVNYKKREEEYIGTRQTMLDLINPKKFGNEDKYGRFQSNFHFYKEDEKDREEKPKPLFRGKKIELLQNIFNERKDFAKKMMFLKYPKLKAIELQLEEYQRTEGKTKPLIEMPTNKELGVVNDAIDRMIGN